ncbi:hypothetical protein J2W92_005077 [Rhizobium leguminosarum]|jgi:hypothetical protein|nr:hypothetical protein [Rhizobium leguminosarum]MDH6273454.1 hypothetical protein [Rhizobium leguminosarum]
MAAAISVDILVSQMHWLVMESLAASYTAFFLEKAGIRG